MDFHDLKSWGSEKWVVDKLVEAVEVGDSQAKRLLAARLLDGYAHNGWRRRAVIATGAIVLHSQLDPDLAERGAILEALEEREDLSDSRRKKIAGGAALTKRERSFWRESVLDGALDEESIDMGDGNRCVVVEIRHADRRRAYVALHSWNGRSGRLVAVQGSYGDAVRSFDEIGVAKLELVALG